MRLQLDSAQLSQVDNRPADAVSESGQSGRGSSTTAPAGDDSISLSGASNAVSQFATDRSARVQQLAAAVQGGTYQVSSAAVSAAIVGHGLS